MPKLLNAVIQLELLQRWTVPEGKTFDPLQRSRRREGLESRAVKRKWFDCRQLRSFLELDGAKVFAAVKRPFCDLVHVLWNRHVLEATVSKTVLTNELQLSGKLKRFEVLARCKHPLGNFR